MTTFSAIPDWIFPSHDEISSDMTETEVPVMSMTGLFLPLSSVRTGRPTGPTTEGNLPSPHPPHRNALAVAAAVLA